MSRITVTIVAALLAAGAVLGTVAVTHTVALGAAHSRSGDAAVRARTRQLDRFEASLRRALAKQPPALPHVPAAPARPAPAQPRVVYRRPPAIVIVRHTRHGDDDGAEAADGGGGDD